jgi:hypothetical protein
MFCLLRLALSLVAGVLLLAATGPEARAAKVAAQCQLASEPSRTECDARAFDFRPDEELRYSSVVVTRSNDQKAITPQEDKEFALTGRTSAFLFVIQESGHPKDALNIIKGRWVLRPTNKRHFGIVSFSDRVKTVAKLGSPENDLRSASVSSDSSRPTHPYYAVREAITTLANYAIEGKPVDRKAVVLFADGRSEKDPYTAKEVEDYAKENNVMIYGVFTERERRASWEDSIRRLTENTNGVFMDAGCRKKGAPSCALDDDVARRFLDYLENGVVVKLAQGDAPEGTALTIALNYSSGPTVKAERVVVRSGGPGGTESWWRFALNWVDQNRVAAGAAGVAAMGLLLFAAAMVARRNRGHLAIPGAGEVHVVYDQAGLFGSASDSTIIAGGDTVILTPTNDRSPPDRIYAWLQFLDANSTRVPIGATSVRIGRHADNDICLQNKTVHRQHAILHKTHEGRFSIRDLGGSNGVVVNNERLQQTDLSDGDLIELGEVRLRFFSNTEALH